MSPASITVGRAKTPVINPSARTSWLQDIAEAISVPRVYRGIEEWRKSSEYSVSALDEEERPASDTNLAQKSRTIHEKLTDAQSVYYLKTLHTV